MMGGGAGTIACQCEAKIDSFDGTDLSNILDGAQVTASDVAVTVFSAFSDPIGTLAGSIANILLSYFDPLKKALDKVVGSPEKVDAKAALWDRVGTDLDSAVCNFNFATSREFSLWTGEAGENAQEFTKAFGAFVSATADRCRDAASSMRFASNLVGAVREIVIDLISDLVGQAISWVAQVALTVGVGATWVVPKAIKKVADWLAKIQKMYTKLTKAIVKIAEKIENMNSIFKWTSKLSSKIGWELGDLIKFAKGGRHHIPDGIAQALKRGPSMRWLVKALPKWNDLAKYAYVGTGGDHAYW